MQAGGESFALGRDFIPRDQGKGARPIDGATVMDVGTVDFNSPGHASPPAAETAGKLVAVRVAPQPDGTPACSVNRAVVTQHFAEAAGIAVVTLDAMSRTDRLSLATAGGQLAVEKAPEQPAFMYVSSRMADALVKAGTAHGTIAFMDVPAADWDANGHPDNSYCRSDHYMYARFGIPVAFFTTGRHRDYHQLTDEQYIDFEKMARVAGLVEDVAVHVADLDHRLVVDKPKPDPEGVQAVGGRGVILSEAKGAMS